MDNYKGRNDSHNWTAIKEIAEKEPYPNLRLLRLTGDGAYEVSKRLGFRLKSKPKFLRLLQYRKTQQRFLRGEI